jgi:type IV secretion system protein TrbL
MDIFTDFVSMLTIWVSAFFIMLGFFVLALQLFVSLVAFKLGALAAFVALPWGIFNGTAWVAERPLGWVAGCAIRLFVLAFIASISITFVDTLPATLTLDGGGALNVLLFGLTVLALAWFAPSLASEVVQGQPQLAGNDAYRAAVGATITGVGAGYVVKESAKGLVGGLVKAGRALSGRGSRSGGGGGGRGPPRPAINYANMRPRPQARPKSSGRNP